jgi:transcriptional regulator with XRE-family HTH domain
MLAERLKELRSARGDKQADAAKVAGITAPAYSAYESGKSVPPLNTIIAFAKHYGVTVDYLCGIDSVNIINQVVSATAVYAFLATLSRKDLQTFRSGEMKLSQFTESSHFKRLSLEQKIWLYDQYQKQDWKKESLDWERDASLDPKAEQGG